MNTTYKSNNNIVYSCKYHVVWCPKYRRKVLTNGVDVRLKELLTEYAANRSVDILEMEIMPDHVYMLLEVCLLYTSTMRFSTLGYSIKQGVKNIWRNKMFSLASIADVYKRQP